MSDLASLFEKYFTQMVIPVLSLVSRDEILPNNESDYRYFTRLICPRLSLNAALIVTYSRTGIFSGFEVFRHE